MSASNAQWSFRTVAADGQGGAVFVAGRDDLTDRHVPMSFAFRWRDRWDQIEIPFIANAIARGLSASEIGLIVGVYAHTLYWDPSRTSEGRIDVSEEGPQHYGDITELRTIKERRHVVGMSRTVYREIGHRRWERIDHDVRAADDEEEDRDPGFTSIDGFADNDVYAVGWEGEIWHYDGRRWQNIDSPTDVVLQRVVCAPDGVVYACGMRGMVLRGRGDGWRIVDDVPTKETFWGATWFSEWLYLSTSEGLYRLEGDTVRAVPPQSETPIDFPRGMSFYRLDADRNRLWSMGRRKILVSDDGSFWREIPLP